MKVAFQDLPDATLEPLRKLLVQGPASGAALYRPSLRWQILLGSITAGVAALGGALTLTAYKDKGTPLWAIGLLGAGTILFSLYAIAAFRDHLLRRRHGLDAFVLLTPFNLVRCWGAHQPLEFHRLRDATEFKTFQDYTQRQRYKGRKFRFKFQKEVVEFCVSDPQLIQQMDEVVELGRARGRGEPLPDLPGTRLPDLMPPGPEAHDGLVARAILNPRSEFWTAVGALICVAILVGIIVSR